MVIEDEVQKAIKSAVSALPDGSQDEFVSWHEKFRQTSVGLRYLYGVHVSYVLDFDRDVKEPINSSRSTPPAVVMLCKSVLELPSEQLGKLSSDFLCLRLDDSTHATRGRLLVLELAGVEALIERLFPDEPLTPAETRTLLQVVSGLSLPEAAAEDDVGHETKRTQLKTVSSKTGRRGQRDLAGFVLARLLFDLSQAATDQPAEGALHDYHDRFLPNDIRVHVTRRRNGATQRILDFGDRNGTPIVVLHAQALPWWSEDDVKATVTQKLRMVWPLRHAALDPQAAPLPFEEHAAHARDGIDTARELFGGEQIVLICLMSACWYGIDYANRHPARVERLVLVGTCYRPTRGDRAPGRLRDGLLRLSSRHRSLMALMVRFVGQRIRDPVRLRAFLDALYVDSPADLSVIAEEFADDKSSESFVLRFVQSESSIVHDFLHLGFPNFDLLSELACPIHFVHGEEDPVHSLDDITALAAANNAHLHVLHGAGQLLYRTHWTVALEAIANAVRK